MTLCKKSKIPTQHVTARYLGRAYPKGRPKKSSPGGPFCHLKFGQNYLMVAAAEMKNIWSPEWFLGQIFTPDAASDSRRQEQEARYHRGKNQKTCIFQIFLSHWILLQPLASHSLCQESAARCRLELALKVLALLIRLYLYPWEEGINKDNILTNGYPSSLLPPPAGHFGQTSSVKRDPLDLFSLALFLDMLFLGT